MPIGLLKAHAPPLEEVTREVLHLNLPCHMPSESEGVDSLEITYRLQFSSKDCPFALRTEVSH